ncbi:MAG: LysE family transporter [Legionellales bacterium]
MIILLTGILIGFIVAAPMGPVGVLCIRKTLEFGLMGTLAVAVGTALSDAFYAGVAALGLAAASELLLEQDFYLKIIGGTLLFALAFKEYFSKNKLQEHIAVTKAGWFGLMITTFFLTLVNPMGVVSFIAIFAMFGEQLESTQSVTLMVSGVFIGSVAWFLLLGKLVAHTQHLLPEKLISSMRKISAFLFASFGAWAFLSLLA